MAVSGGGFGQGTGPIFFRTLQCGGDEENLLQCASSGVALHQTCGHSNDAGVICASKLVPVMDHIAYCSIMLYQECIPLTS